MPLILPPPDRLKQLKAIHPHLYDYRFGSQDAKQLIAATELMFQDPLFQKTLMAEKVAPLKTETDLKVLAWKFFYMLLSARDYVSASLFLWGPKTFTIEPNCARLIWDALFRYNQINVMGCGSVGKTYAPSAWVLLDWLLDPEWTRVQVISNSEDHVKKNLFGDLVRLHSESCLELPGKVDTESISLDKKRAMGIFVLVVPGGPTAKGKLKGAKIKNRPKHPLFGENSRLRILLDEAQEIPGNLFDELPNLLSSVSGTEHIKVLCAANPKDEWSPYGKNCKPVGGWEKIGALQEEWEGETGWHVIRINAMLTENVMQRKVIFDRMITYEGVQKIIRSQGGGNDQHPIVYTFVYGMFPPQGVTATVINTQHLRKAQGEWIFETNCENFASFDVAYTGDLPTFAFGRTGRAIGFVDQNGQRTELSEPRWACQVDGVVIIPRGDTQDMADENLFRLKSMSVPPEHFAIDKTGTGIGVHDIIKRQWVQKVGRLAQDAGGSAGILGICYAESATETKVADEDTQVAREVYDSIVSEMWYAGGKLLEYDVVRFGRGVDDATFDELGARRGGLKVGQGRRLSVESKAIYKSRTGSGSPDRADAVLMLLHAMRMNVSGLLPKAKDTKIEKPVGDTMAWGGFDLAFQGASISGYSEGAFQVGDTMKD